MTQATQSIDGGPTGARHTRILIIGAGFAGLGAAIRLDQAGQKDFLVVERGSEVGGTWRDNTYPGAACDVPSQLYSFSFAPNREWSRSFSGQPEIQAYIRKVALESGVLDRHLFDTEVTGAEWDAAARIWRVETDRGPITADVVVPAVGALCEPSLPAITGIEDFAGTVFHSSRWNHDEDLTGKRVAVIGTGASAIQIVPAIAGKVAHLDVYQRTAPWVLPRADRKYTAIERLAYRHLPGMTRLARAGVYALRETQVLGLTRIPSALKPLQLAAQAHLRMQIRDPQLRAKVTPDFQIGCKRMLISNNYYPALARENVDVVTDPIREVKAHSIVTADGTEREIDVLIVATGFHVTDSPMFDLIRGTDGSTLAQSWDVAGMRGYKGTTVPGFPNMFFLVGPNTGLGHSSMVYMIESQINYVIDALATMDREKLASVEVRPEPVAQFNDWIQQRLSTSVWNTGGCASWYLDKHGNNTTLWPGHTFQFRNATRTFDVTAYDTVPVSAGAADRNLEETAS